MKKELWSPSADQIKNSNMTRFAQTVGRKHGLTFATYDDLYRWSVENIEQFWASIWDASGVIHSAPYEKILSSRQMPGARWFEGARMNFARNLLKYRDDHPAIIHWDETGRATSLTYQELYSQVAACAEGLKKLGIRRGDRVAAIMPNIPQTVIAMLATTSLGALWSSCSPDFGEQGLLDRFGQIRPKLLIATDGYRYKGRPYQMTKHLSAVASKLPSLEQVVIVPLLDTGKVSTTVPQCSWLELMATPSPRIDFEELPFDHPVYIMYSSGTTGVPKGIIHGAGGTLLQHYKEHVLHTNLKRDDLILYYTTCGWMMWNWLVSALAVGTTIFLYDGSPVWPDTGILWKAIEQEGIAVFGTSPKYLAGCQQQGLVPSKQFDLSSLRTILATGSPLTAENYSWVYTDVKKDVQLASISGGTDIISCFLLGNPNLPVLSEEIQCRGLGMKVAAYDDQGQSLTDKVGELVCTAPFPSMPVAFWNDPGSKRYRQAYFEAFPDVWRHGDYIKITDHGGVIVYGRSDATLNPGGIRIGTAEIYGPVEGMAEVADSIVIGQQWLGDIRIVLFVMLSDGLKLTELLSEKIKKRIASQTTPRHVPGIILQVDDIPRTMNGKKVEMAVRQVVEGQEVPNRSALANPEALDQYTSFPQLKAN